MNILMFGPFGFLLPCLSKRFQKFWVTYLAGFGFTLVIESLQFVFKLGIFECDDLINNTIGTMIGYGIYKIVQFIVLKWKRQEIKIVNVLFAQIPAIVTVFAFVMVFKMYDEKELGNLSSNAFYELENVTAETEISLSQENNRAMVYQLHIAGKDETRQLAESIFGNMGLEIDESRTILYDDTAIYYSISNESTGTKSLWVDYLGSTFNYTDFDKFEGKENLESQYQKKQSFDMMKKIKSINL